MARTQPSPPEHLFRLAEDVTLKSEADHCIIERPGRAMRLPDPRSTACQVAASLADWIAPATLFARVIATGGSGAAIEAQSTLDTFEKAGFLEEGLRLDGTLALTCRLYPGSGLGPADTPAPATPPFVLAPHTSLIPQSAGWRIASPLAWGEVLIRDAGLFTRLASANHGWTPDDAASTAMAGFLAKAGLLVAQAASPARTALAMHELWQHALSRRATAPGPVGATGRPHAEQPPPTARTRPTTQTVDLPIPAQPAPIPFQQVLDSRLSRRTSGARPGLSPAHLGALLWTAARDLAPPWHDDDGYLRHARPYPAAGGIHACDLFLALKAPASLPAFSRYEPDRHCLSPLPAGPGPLLQDAALSMGDSDAPEALIILSARFGPMAQKYGMAAYALMLKDAGVLLQTLHLSATALGIGSCILGGGNSREFASLTGLDPLIEGPIGEIALTGILPFQPKGEPPHD